jgi:hypothetical protein
MKQRPDPSYCTFSFDTSGITRNSPVNIRIVGPPDTATFASLMCCLDAPTSAQFPRTSTIAKLENVILFYRALHLPITVIGVILLTYARGGILRCYVRAAYKIFRTVSYVDIFFIAAATS